MTKRRSQNKRDVRRQVSIREAAVFASLSDANLYASVIHQVAKAAQGDPEMAFASLVAIEVLSQLVCFHVDKVNVEVLGNPGFGTFSEYFRQFAVGGGHATPE